MTLGAEPEAERALQLQSSTPVWLVLHLPAPQSTGILSRESASPEPLSHPQRPVTQPPGGSRPRSAGGGPGPRTALGWLAGPHAQRALPGCCERGTWQTPAPPKPVPSGKEEDSAPLGAAATLGLRPSGFVMRRRDAQAERWNPSARTWALSASPCGPRRPGAGRAARPARFTERSRWRRGQQPPATHAARTLATPTARRVRAP